MKKDIVRILPGDRPEFTRLRTLYEHHTQLAQALQGQLQALVTRYGLDLENEHWELDVEQGVLRRVNAG